MCIRDRVSFVLTKGIDDELWYKLHVASTLPAKQLNSLMPLTGESIAGFAITMKRKKAPNSNELVISYFFQYLNSE